ncbi:MAG: hypothetical protein HQL50_07000 [Magnetococcales bacterium]|nr:hypothetical protein [Magnetococcales bacterium]
MQRFLIDPFTDSVSAFFGLIILTFFLIGTFKSLNSKRSLSLSMRYAPTALTTIGVIGTFVGIYIGLINFDVTDIDGSIPSLLSGLKIAFSTSILGMVTSVFLKLIQGSRKREEVKEHISGKDIYSVLSQLHETTRLNGERGDTQLQELRRSISGDGDGSLITQIQKMRTSLHDDQTELKRCISEGFSLMVSEFQNYTRVVTENNSKALMEALQEVIQDFNTKLTEQFGENFKQLNTAVGELVVWQEHYKAQMEIMIEQFEQSRTGIQDVRKAISEIANETKAIPPTLHNLQTAIGMANEQTGSLKQHLEAVAGLKDRAMDAFPVIERNIQTLTHQMTNAVNESTQHIVSVVDNQNRSFQTTMESGVTMLESSAIKHQETLKHLEDGATALPRQVEDLIAHLQTSMTQAHDKLASELERSFKEQAMANRETIGGLQESINQSLKDTNDMLTDSFQVFDEQMQTELKRTIETMGGHLASLSTRFVDDYRPLTDQLRRVVEMAHGVDHYGR